MRLAEHYARQHQGVGLLIIRAIKLLKRMVRCVALRRWRGAELTLALRRAISMFSVVPVSYNVVDEMCKERKPRDLDPIELNPA